MVHLDVDNLRHLSTIVLLFLVAVAVVIRVAVDDVSGVRGVVLVALLLCCCCGCGCGSGLPCFVAACVPGHILG